MKSPLVPPFTVDDNNFYRDWRESKLQDVPRNAVDLSVSICNPLQPDSQERAALAAHLLRHNLVLCSSSPDVAVESDDVNVASVLALGRSLGLHRLDHNPLSKNGITPLTFREVAGLNPDGAPADYIPYSRRALSWHTDGYYNDSDHRVQAIILYCVRPALSGGENSLLDHELVYIRLRDANVAYITAFFDPEAMLIPENRTADGKLLRAQVPGPVFSIADNGRLHMRYSARKKNIIWKQSPVLNEARELLKSLLQNDPAVLHIKLSSGQALICNNVLHNRTAFEDGNNAEEGNHAEDGSQARLIFRARYLDCLTFSEHPFQD